MKTIDTVFWRIGLAFGTIFAGLIAIELDLLPASLRGDGLLFHWQVWLLAGIVIIALRDMIASMHCCMCRRWDVPSLGGVLTIGKVLCQSCIERKGLGVAERVTP